jgi:hypothetical protein
VNIGIILTHKASFNQTIKTFTIMADLTNNEITVALSNIFQTVGTLAQQGVQLAGAVINTAGSIIEPITKTVGGLVCNCTTSTPVASAPVAKVYQGSAAPVAPVAPKK